MVATTKLIHEQETYKILGACMEVHRELGHGFLEVVYKDALMLEFEAADIPFERERKYEIEYKSVILPHCFYADFVVYGSVILEVKSMQSLPDEHIAQTLNYLRASGCRVGLLINFGRQSLDYKRLIY